MRNSSSKDTKHSLFVMLRRYRGLRSGFGVTNKSVSYEPFKLQLHFRETPPDEISTSIVNPIPCNKNTPSINSSVLLVIRATPVRSVYKSKKSHFLLPGIINHATFFFYFKQRAMKFLLYNVITQSSSPDSLRAEY